ncbi:PIR protein [Plasmodium vivax]|nr:PIR protein [Plasmodium vivax]
MTGTDLISDLPSYQFYNKLNNNISGNGYSIQCNSISKDPSEQEILNTICTQLSKNIHDLENEDTQDHSFFDKHCYDLNYWLYDQVTNKLVKNKNTNNIYSVFEKIQNIWKNIERQEKPGDNKKKCVPESKLFKTGLFEYFKQLLDYIENYQTIEQGISQPSEQRHKYCAYILKIAPFYFMLQQLYSVIKIDICEKYIKNNNKYNPSKLLDKFSCEVGNTYKGQLEGNLLREMINTDHSDLGKFFRNSDLTKLDFKNLGLTNLNLSGSGSSHFGLPGFGLSGFGYPGNLQSMLMNNIVDLVQKGVDVSSIKDLFNNIPYLSDIYNYDIIHKYVVPALYGLGGLLFFFILYKCRGCLPCCCIFRRRKKRRKRLSDFDTNGLISAPLGFPSPMMPINPYGLRYQPF